MSTRSPLMMEVLPSDRLPHGWQVLATLLAGASIFTLCWYLSQRGLLDLAATGISFYLVTFVRSLGGALTARAPKEFKRSASLIDTMRSDWDTWMANRRLLSLALIAGVATTFFMIGRSVASVILVAIASPWLALAIGLAITAAVASPYLVKSLARTVGRSVSGEEGAPVEEPAPEDDPPSPPVKPRSTTPPPTPSGQPPPPPSGQPPAPTRHQEA